MTRYIDADALKEFIENAPTVDAVPVIRCKDCGHWEYADSGVDGTTCGECYMLSMMTADTCFCYWAERKEE